jgi:DNA-3-methyladenine glycosylase
MANPDKSFFVRSGVTRVAADLLGKLLVSEIKGKRTSGIIVETEAYSWKERGCHAWQNRKTRGNSSMFLEGGFAYVYLCYGIHNLLNVVTGKEGFGEAVLIRALEPVDGIEIMKQRTGARSEHRITSGPGKLTKALGITTSLDKSDLLRPDAPLFIEDSGIRFKGTRIDKSPRIGINYAGADALLPWRFSVRGNSWVSIPVIAPGSDLK